MTLIAAALTAVVPATAITTPTAQADTVAYLVNVTVRPGYGFVSADEALAYGYGVCATVRRRTPYGQVLNAVMRDFATGDDYQGAYLINQAVNELCPELIWQLRTSAAGYTRSAPPGGSTG